MTSTTKRKGIGKKILIAVVVIIIAIQFIHPAKNISQTTTPDDINVLYPVPDSIIVVLKKACYDCHSNNTAYPWYNNIQPVAWWLADHIDDGKKELNFSEFGKRPVAKRAKKLKKLAKEVEDGDMPLSSYTWIHRDAILTPAEKQLVIDWANSLAKKIEAESAPAANK